MKEYNVKELPTDGVYATGEIGVLWMDGRWERNGQRLLCPLSKLILQHQPQVTSWLQAAAVVTGWTQARAFAFKMKMGRAPITTGKGTNGETIKGVTDATLYDLLFKLSRKMHRGRAS